MIDAKSTGAFIAQCRRERHWTQKQLGEELGVSDRAVSKWETGRSLPDISLIEPICAVFEISVSEFLAGRKIRPEEYRDETEQLLIRTISENQLFGFQIVIHLLELVTIMICLLPFLLNKDRFLPECTTGNIICWIIAAVLAGILIYLDKNLPARKYRFSNPWIEGIAGGCQFVIILFVNFSISATANTLQNTSKADQAFVAALSAIGLASVIAVRVLASRTRRKEWVKNISAIDKECKFRVR